MADQRQDDHPVQSHQEAASLGIVDWRDAALRRARPEPGAEQEVEGAPVDECLENLLPELARQALGIADLGEDHAARDHERDQRNHVEQHGEPEGPERRVADQAVEAPQPGTAQQQAHGIFRRQAGDHDAQQQKHGAAVDDLGQARQMAAQSGDLLQREFQPLGQELQERARGAFGAVGRLGRGRAGPRRGETAQRRCPGEP
jgi:hypothetical protein